MSIPTPGFYTQRTTLSGVSYLLTFRYNSRMDRWLLDIADANAQLLLAGLPILGAWSVAGRFAGLIRGLPLGHLAAADLTGAQRDPQENTLGSDVPIFYMVP